MSASGFPGSRVAAIRAGITTSGFIESSAILSNLCDATPQ
jgi:hypothetical protein